MSHATNINPAAMTLLERVETVTVLVEALVAATQNQPHDLVLDALLSLYINLAMSCPGCAASGASVLPLIARDLDAIAAAARASGATSHAIH